MKLLIFGVTGMLGHRLCRVLSDRFEIWATFRQKAADYPQIIDSRRAISNVNVEDLSSVTRAFETVKPDIVVNCIGIIKQRDEAKQAIPSIKVNALFPHQLVELCARHDSYMIQISTDCVFSGLRGNYTETDIPDPVDIYSGTKLIGEVNQSNCLTIRTSMIGWQLNTYTSLLEWFAVQRGRQIKGFRKAIYSGFSTTVLSTLLGDIVENHPNLNGLYHLASEPISKFDLLVQIRDALGWDDIIIDPDDKFFCDRSLNSQRFATETGWKSPSWADMIAGLASEWSEYHSAGLR